MEQFVKAFKALGEPTRLKILKLLSGRSMYVCELESVLQMSQPRISQHLRVLKEASILRETKEAQRTFYMINGDVVERMFGDFIHFLRVDLTQLPDFEEERLRMQRLDSDSCALNCKAGRAANC